MKSNERNIRVLWQNIEKIITTFATLTRHPVVKPVSTTNTLWPLPATPPGPLTDTGRKLTVPTRNSLWDIALVLIGIQELATAQWGKCTILIISAYLLNLPEKRLFVNVNDFFLKLALPDLVTTRQFNVRGPIWFPALKILRKRIESIYQTSYNCNINWNKSIRQSYNYSLS